MRRSTQEDGRDGAAKRSFAQKASHIKGKKDWVPYEQTGFLYRRFKNHHADLKGLALEIGMSAKRVKHLVDMYQFMLEHGEDDINRWSDYDEYLKSNKIRRARERCPQLDSVIIEGIRMGDIERATDLRVELAVVCSTPKVLSKFVAGTYDFFEACDAALRVGGECPHLRTVKKLLV